MLFSVSPLFCCWEPQNACYPTCAYIYSRVSNLCTFLTYEIWNLKACLFLWSLFSLNASSDFLLVNTFKNEPFKVFFFSKGTISFIFLSCSYPLLIVIWVKIFLSTAYYPCYTWKQFKPHNTYINLNTLSPIYGSVIET